MLLLPLMEPVSGQTCNPLASDSHWFIPFSMVEDINVPGIRVARSFSVVYDVGGIFYCPLVLSSSLQLQIRRKPRNRKDVEIQKAGTHIKNETDISDVTLLQLKNWSLRAHNWIQRLPAMLEEELNDTEMAPVLLETGINYAAFGGWTHLLERCSLLHEWEMQVMKTYPTFNKRRSHFGTGCCKIHPWHGELKKKVLQGTEGCSTCGTFLQSALWLR